MYDQDNRIYMVSGISPPPHCLTSLQLVLHSVSKVESVLLTDVPVQVRPYLSYDSVGIVQVRSRESACSSNFIRIWRADWQKAL